MATYSNFEESSKDEIDFSFETPSTAVQPYMFEPRKNSEARQRKAKSASCVDEDRLGSLMWCQCSNCTLMPTSLECQCCKEGSQVVKKMEGHNIKCIIEHSGFNSVCLDMYVLETVYTVYKRLHGRMDCALHEKYRYSAYHQLVRWCWGIMGRQVRVPVPLPACAVRKIRATYPEGGRVGFKWPEVE